jgi:hypothetical protein
MTTNISEILVRASHHRIEVSPHFGGFYSAVAQQIPADLDGATAYLKISTGGEVVEFALTDLQLALIGRTIDGWAQSVVGPKGVWEEELNP